VKPTFEVLASRAQQQHAAVAALDALLAPLLVRIGEHQRDSVVKQIRVNEAWLDAVRALNVLAFGRPATTRSDGRLVTTVAGIVVDVDPLLALHEFGFATEPEIVDRGACAICGWGERRHATGAGVPHTFTPRPPLRPYEDD
jgi:hypothetical protein